MGKILRDGRFYQMLEMVTLEMGIYGKNLEMGNCLEMGKILRDGNIWKKFRDGKNS
jgi:hypothetical protein